MQFRGVTRTPSCTLPAGGIPSQTPSILPEAGRTLHHLPEARHLRRRWRRLVGGGAGGLAAALLFGGLNALLADDVG